MIRILIADDHPTSRGGIRFMLESQADFEVAGEATNGAEAVRLVGELRPDVVLMDLAMPVMSGVEATRRLHERHPEAQVLVFTAYGDDENVVEALRAGAVGYVLKDAGGQELCRAVRSASAGRLVFGAAIASRLTAREGDRAMEPGVPSGTLPPQSVRAAAGRPLVPESAKAAASSLATQGDSGVGLPARMPLLTEREREVLGLLAQGLPNKEIAARLVISQRTAKFHVSSILTKLGAGNRTEAVTLAVQRGLIAL